MFSAASAALAVTLLTGCDGFKSAMNSHVDVAASAGSQELSVMQLAEYLSEARVDPDENVARALANAWIEYQLLANEAATGDTIIAKKVIDEANWASIGEKKARMLYDRVSATWGTPGADFAKEMYADGDVLAASHILFITQEKTDAEKAVALKKAEALLPQLTSENFARMAAAHTEEPGGKERAGALGVFQKGQMVPEFENGVIALQPGEVSGIVESAFGYHIIRRATFEEVENEISENAQALAMKRNERKFIEDLQKNGKLDVKTGIKPTVLAVLENPEEHLKDGKVLATSAAGKFTAGRLAEWITIMPPYIVMQQKMGMEAGDDSLAGTFIKSFATNELVLHAADTAKLAPTEEELEETRRQLLDARSNAWMQLGVTPFILADSNRSVKEREVLASSRVDRYLTGLISGMAGPIEMPPALTTVLKRKKKVKINQQGIDRAVEQAQALRAQKDAEERENEPSSVIPMPSDTEQE